MFVTSTESNNSVSLPGSCRQRTVLLPVTVVGVWGVGVRERVCVCGWVGACARARAEGGRHYDGRSWGLPHDVVSVICIRVSWVLELVNMWCVRENGGGGGGSEREGRKKETFLRPVNHVDRSGQRERAKSVGP